jgi:hypothetical protein
MSRGERSDIMRGGLAVPTSATPWAPDVAVAAARRIITVVTAMRGAAGS